ncbi:hypothetical protein EXN66_Car018823 [Channa argus]|uniref:Uncharacterized protein n=1 Tax=Channa argus TaxID=215402 RepID=A0A6G1QKQ5_CHAAH|nr:hypothetical protein EXN66_Car018823 [Channa argus]
MEIICSSGLSCEFRVATVARFGRMPFLTQPSPISTRLGTGAVGVGCRGFSV